MTFHLHRSALATMIVVASLAAGCASSKSGSAYTRDQTRQEMIVRTGIVESVREVQIEGTKSGVGAAAGAVAGVVVGCFQNVQADSEAASSTVIAAASGRRERMGSGICGGLQ